MRIFPRLWWTEHNVNLASKKEPIDLITNAVSLRWCENKAIKSDRAQRGGLCSFVHMLAAPRVCVCVVCHFSAHTTDSYRSLVNLSPPLSFWAMRKMLPSNDRHLLYWACWCSVTYTFSALLREKNHNKEDTDFYFNIASWHKRSSWLSSCLL